MLSTRILILISCIFLWGCSSSEQTNPFNFGKNKVGKLTPQTSISAIDSLYKNDSIVNRNHTNALLSNTNEIEIYDSSGKKLLIIEPSTDDTNSAMIKSIQIIDPRYSTEEGISINSTFKDVRETFPISKINNTLSTAVVFVDSLNAYITIDKKFLPTNYKNNTDIKIEANVIPDSATIKHFWIQWNPVK
ncbi:hypothetical protein ACJRPK_17050 [Aquimarina sp. 2-A2]|uniref:hypothetical protein n=1 Tax=Aquimarina sp. 2-A2 TaxID=3382644 RepID=UPI00387F06A5